MSSPLLYPLPNGADLAAALALQMDAELGEIRSRRFPDGEAYVRLQTDPQGRDVVFVGSLDRPDEKAIELYFAAATARELGARSVGLVAPYLAYMRQDARFNPGEAITSVHFARWLSQFLDWLVTVDPHLHRHPTLDCIYSIPSKIVAAAPAISTWIRSNIVDPLVVGPDAESAQWAGQIAAGAQCPHVVLTKTRRGDRDVEISLPDLSRWSERTPVLIDDIISTGRTMIVAIEQLRAAGMTCPAVCVGVHALFASGSVDALSAAAAKIVTCNTIAHASNAIDVVADIACAVKSRIAGV